jgi:hypothetical protein
VKPADDEIRADSDREAEDPKPFVERRLAQVGEEEGNEEGGEEQHACEAVADHVKSPW